HGGPPSPVQVLFDHQEITALDFNHGPTFGQSDAFLLGVKNTSFCKSKFATAPDPVSFARGRLVGEDAARLSSVEEAARRAGSFPNCGAPARGLVRVPEPRGKVAAGRVSLSAPRSPSPRKRSRRAPPIRP